MVLTGLAILLLFLFIGETVARLTGLPIPGSVIGLLMMLGALHMGWVKLERVERTAQFLLSHMLLFFAPVIAGTIVFYHEIVDEWLPALATIVIGAFAVLAAAGHAAKALEKKSGYDEAALSSVEKERE